MSFNRLHFDNDAYKHSLLQSVGPGAYLLGTPRNDCQTCYPEDPSIRIERGGGGASCPAADLVDVDSELMGISRKRSLCPSKQYLPGQTKNVCQPRLPARNCQRTASEDTRVSNPACNGRGTENGFNRWQWLPCDPQSGAIARFPMNTNYRLVVKDNHRPCVTIPNSTTALPPKLPPPTLPSVHLPSWLPEQHQELSWAHCDTLRKA